MPFKQLLNTLHLEPT